ncbi:phosphonate ABC transporter, permease protein PhnE [Bombilactobacillus bombi]|uniref:phosphonate ABC transporter, permease protein PhnE n=1 Tax=Bombilactobacillus bombi TaxID=1303590 RepID=UPI0015E60BDD|nr:phosphonate ABC transporter, permease protein PhnE [Bombilactobacillus bombi]MBA1434232.1 phosphonate ABC transporter, permease protein PhnE [Bombilactobacillus bombi]
MNQLPTQSWTAKWHLKTIIIVLILCGLLIKSAQICEINGSALSQNFSQFFDLLKKMSHPQWSYGEIVLQPIIETIKMAIIGTTLGAICALPLCIFAARNIITNRFITSSIRFILNIIRTIPDLMLAAVFVAIVGIGPLAGIFTLAVFSFGMIAKLFYEAIETIDNGPLEALEAAGANKVQIIVFAVLPQVMNNFISYFLYTLEINVRASTVLGYLGAGGIGVYLQRSLDSYNYQQTAIIILAILVVVLIIDGLSNYLREKLL